MEWRSTKTTAAIEVVLPPELARLTELYIWPIGDTAPDIISAGHYELYSQGLPSDTCYMWTAVIMGHTEMVRSMSHMDVTDTFRCKCLMVAIIRWDYDMVMAISDDVTLAVITAMAIGHHELAVRLIEATDIAPRAMMRACMMGASQVIRAIIKRTPNMMCDYCHRCAADHDNL